jgi:hypothetical protein
VQERPPAIGSPRDLAAVTPAAPVGVRKPRECESFRQQPALDIRLIPETLDRVVEDVRRLCGPGTIDEQA